MGWTSICDKCIKVDVCDQKAYTKEAERKAREIMGLGVIKEGHLSWDNARLSESFDLKNKGISLKVECSRRASGYED